MKSYDPSTTEYTGEVCYSYVDALAYVHRCLGEFAEDFDTDAIADEMFDIDFERMLYYPKAYDSVELGELFAKYDNA